MELRSGLVACALFACGACNQLLGFSDPTLDGGTASVGDGGVDAPADGAASIDASNEPPDAAACQPVGAACSADQLCTCDGSTQQCATCALGCSTVGEAHCVSFVPTNLGAAAEDLTAGTEDLVLTVGAIDTDALTVAGVAPTIGVVRLHVQGASSPDIAVFRYRTIEVQGTIHVRGSRALALVASESISITGELVHEGVSNDCPS
ncbi:MAG: hypothetical protein KC464_26955, partial [Myxococcales bacterium]|nr:hypothetical protein [Myxococcales bacterium]